MNVSTVRRAFHVLLLAFFLAATTSTLLLPPTAHAGNYGKPDNRVRESARSTLEALEELDNAARAVIRVAGLSYDTSSWYGDNPGMEDHADDLLRAAFLKADEDRLVRAAVETSDHSIQRELVRSRLRATSRVALAAGDATVESSSALRTLSSELRALPISATSPATGPETYIGGFHARFAGELALLSEAVSVVSGELPADLLEAWAKTPPTRLKPLLWALAHVGDPYIPFSWSPPGYDCSGFVLASWLNTTGAVVPGSSYEMWKQLPEVQESAMLPGDLVLFYRGRHPDGRPDGHVETYLGVSNLVVGSTASVGVRIGRYKRGNPVGFARVPLTEPAG